MTEPSYVKTTWADTPATSSPIDADNLNHLEQGVSDAIGRATKSVRYDAAQSLNPTDQATGRGNLGLGGMATAQPGDFTALPSYVGVRTKPFDARSSLYNGTAPNFRTIRAKANAVRQGDTLRVTAIGDSTTAGAGATAQTSWPVQLLDLLGLPVKGTGAVFGSQGITDSRWTSTGTVTGAGAYAQMSAAATKTFTSDRAGTDADIRFYRNSGAFDVLVDSAIISAGVTVTGGTYNTSTGRVTPDGSLSAGKVTITGLASSTHAVKVTSVATTFLIAVNVYASGSAGVQISNMGVPSTKVADWTSTAFASFYQQATLELADAFILTLVVNDSSAATTVATYKTNLTTIATNLKAIAPVILVAGPNASGTSSTNHQPYVSAIYDIADSLDLPVFDLFHRWGNYLNANNLGLIADTVHPNAKGYADWAQAMSAALQLAGGGSTGSSASINDSAPSTGSVYSSSKTEAAIAAATSGLATKTANYNMLAADRLIVANGSSITISLPDPTGVTAGRPYLVKNINASAATLNSQGTSKTIDGAASFSVVQYAAFTVVSDGTQWLIV
jgi:lysophospholipase L1-like esterase